MFTLDESKSIIRMLPTTFDSHEFIRIGALSATPSFIDLLRQYHGDFTIIDSQIGSFLLRNSEQLSISKVEEQISETIIGTQSKCALWKKQ